MKSIVRHIFLLFPVLVAAQKADTVRRSFIPTGIRLGADLIPPIYTYAGKSFNGLELSADVDFYRYYLSADIGRWERNFEGTDSRYSNSGNYYRMGVDINFLKKDPDRNMLFFGMRYGRSRFDEKLERMVADPVWGTRSEVQSVEGRSAGWMEITGGLRVKMYRFIWMGYTVRYKFALHTSGTGVLDVYDVPGYGSTAKPVTWGFNYLIMVRLPLRGE